MKVLLTGAGGFLGSRVASALLEQGVTDLRLQYRQNVPARLHSELCLRFPAARIECVAANLLSRPSCAAIVDGVDLILHAAAGMRGAAADIFLNTVVASRNLLDAAAGAGVRRLTLVSSFSVYKTDGLRRDTVMDESTPLETVGDEKGAYGYAKSRQEALFREYRKIHGNELVILRPGVIYGPGGGEFSSRVGIAAMGLFFNLGGPAMLPLSYVDNCADAIVTAALMSPDGGIYNVVDDGLPTCSQYLRQFQREVRKLRVLRVPYWLFMLGSRWLQSYNRKSLGQLPAVFSPYVVRSMFRPLRYSNAALTRIGWQQRVTTPDGLARNFRNLAHGAHKS
ncbi:MAG: NAD(P)-dependent oxidoreductase [Pseudomonadota bacterium]